MKIHYKRILLGEMAQTRSAEETYTCEQVGEVEWCCKLASESEMLDFDYADNEPREALMAQRYEYGDMIDLSEPIQFCPFCGVPVELVEDETVRLVKKLTPSTITSWEHGSL